MSANESEMPPIVEESEDDLPENVVLVANSKTGGGRKWHDDPNCRYLTDRHREWDKDEAEAWGYEKCQRCAGEIP